MREKKNGIFHLKTEQKSTVGVMVGCAGLLQNTKLLKRRVGIYAQCEKRVSFMKI